MEGDGEAEKIKFINPDCEYPLCRSSLGKAKFEIYIHDIKYVSGIPIQYWGFKYVFELDGDYLMRDRKDIPVSAVDPKFGLLNHVKNILEENKFYLTDAKYKKTLFNKHKLTGNVYSID